MNRQNWYFKELVTVDNMATLESECQAGTKQSLVLLNNRGIASGLAITATGADKHVSIAAGTVVLEDGSVVVKAVATDVDLSDFTGGAGTVNLFLIPKESGDTPLLSPGGMINYRLFDDFQVVAQLSTTTHNPIPTTAFTGTLIGTVTIPGVVATIINGYISQATADRWVDITTIQQEILALQRFNRHVLVPSSGAPTFDGTVALSFELVLTADAVLNPIAGWNAGERITVVLIQDGTGGHAFTWPAGVPGDAPEPDAGSISTYQFKKTIDGRIVNLGGQNVNS